MKLQDLLSIKDESTFRETCDDYLQLIGRGSSRNVYRLNHKQVIKVANNDWGYTQNASECNTFNAYKDLEIFNEIIRNANNYLWVIQPIATPLKNNDVQFRQLVDLIQHIEETKVYITNNSFLKKFYDLLTSVNWKYLFDFKKCNSYGLVNGDLRIIDYGMNNEAYKEYFKRN